MKSDENAKKVGKNKRIYFALSSLNRNFDLRSKIGYASEKSKNVWFFVRLALPLQPLKQKGHFFASKMQYKNQKNVLLLQNLNAH